MAAVTGAILPFLKNGDHMVCGDTMYGPSIHVVTNVFSKYGIQSTVIDTSNAQVSYIPGFIIFND